MIEGDCPKFEDLESQYKTYMKENYQQIYDKLPAHLSYNLKDWPLFQQTFIGSPEAEGMKELSAQGLANQGTNAPVDGYRQL